MSMLGNWLTEFAAFLGVACILLVGCGTGTPSSPEEFFAPWDSLQFLSSSDEDSLTIFTDGTIDYRTDDRGASGLVSATTLGELKAAARQIDFDTWPAGESGGAVILSRGGERLGFVWEDEAQLSGHERRMVSLLDGVRIKARTEALSDGSERPAEWISASPLFFGSRARTAVQDTRVIRNSDALLLALRESVGEDRVVLPEVDFDSEMVIAVFAGEQPAGSEVHVDPMVGRTFEEYLQVPVTLYRPTGECPAAETVRPYEFVRLRKTDLEVFFLWELVPIECP